MKVEVGESEPLKTGYPAGVPKMLLLWSFAERTLFVLENSGWLCLIVVQVLTLIPCGAMSAPGKYRHIDIILTLLRSHPCYRRLSILHLIMDSWNSRGGPVIPWVHIHWSPLKVVGTSSQIKHVFLREVFMSSVRTGSNSLIFLEKAASSCSCCDDQQLFGIFIIRIPRRKAL